MFRVPGIYTINEYSSWLFFCLYFIDLEYRLRNVIQITSEFLTGFTVGIKIHGCVVKFLRGLATISREFSTGLRTYNETLNGNNLSQISSDYSTPFALSRM